LFWGFPAITRRICNYSFIFLQICTS
jgi:hypothetical protein